MAEEVEVDPTHAIAQGGVEDVTRGCFGSLIILFSLFLTVTGVSLMISLLNHERLHQEKLMLYLSWVNLDLPQSFTQTWGESNFPKR